MSWLDRHDGHRPVQLLQHVVKLAAALGVDAGHGLVQKENLGTRDQRPGNEHALQLPAGEFADPPVPVFPQPHPLQRLLRGDPVLPGMPGPSPAGPQTPHQDDIEDGNRESPC